MRCTRYAFGSICPAGVQDLYRIEAKIQYITREKRVYREQFKLGDMKMKRLKRFISIVIVAGMLFSYGFSVKADDKGLIMPEYENIISAVNKVNEHYQATVGYDELELGVPNCFLYKTVYQTGNLEAYYVTGNKAYLEYAENWAESCNWEGHPSKNDKILWTWGYSQTFAGNAVLFSNFQGCFQVYIDLYNMEKDEPKIERALEVMSYQTSLNEDSFWHMADSLYMGLPLMVKLYHLTDEEKYLDCMYKYFKYTKELLYDGPGGIPENEDGYTTSARLNEGAQYSDSNNHKYLFYPDASYVYPRRLYEGIDEKMFSAKDNGLVFAALARVLKELPEEYEHYDEFLNTYTQMAKAIKQSMCIDENGYGFWTQNMLLKKPVASYNPNGYETYSTAMFTYALAWGINAGILDYEEYDQNVIRAWNYLENIALKDDGSLRYAFDVARSATGASTERANINSYSVGAFLLAGCEMSEFIEQVNVNQAETEMAMSGDGIICISLRALREAMVKVEDALRALLEK